MDYQRETNFGPYEILNEIASGAGVVIKKVYHKDWNQHCCVKIVNKKDHLDQVKQEVKICSELKWIFHENLTRIFDIQETDEKVYIFQELCDHDLTKKEKYSITQILELIIQISSGYEQLIKKNILHRDIKQENILTKKNKEGKTIYKIVDFGTCIKLSDRLETKSQQGTKAKQAPEIAQSRYSEKADIFSFGLVLLELYLDVKIEEKAYKFLIHFLKQHDFLQIQTTFIDQEQLKIQIKQPNIIKFDPQDDVMKLINSLLFYDRERRMSWQDLNIKAKQLINNANNQTTITPNSNRKSNISINLQPYQNFQQINSPQNVNQQQRITHIQQQARPLANNPSNSQQIQYKNNQNQDYNRNLKSNLPEQTQQKTQQNINTIRHSISQNRLSNPQFLNQQPFQAQKQSDYFQPPNNNQQNIQQYPQNGNYQYQQAPLIIIQNSQNPIYNQKYVGCQNQGHPNANQRYLFVK